MRRQKRLARSFPKGYVAEVLGAYLPATTVIAAGFDSGLVRPGDRFIVDTPAAGRSYVLVDRSGAFLLLTAKTDAGDEPWGARGTIVGLVCGKIGNAGMDMPKATVSRS